MLFSNKFVYRTECWKVNFISMFLCIGSGFCASDASVAQDEILPCTHIGIDARDTASDFQWLTMSVLGNNS